MKGFKEYESKPITRLARRVGERDQIVPTTKESTSVLNALYLEPIPFKHYEPVKVGDYIVFLNEKDVYHCTKEVFEERNIV